jgi:hypothetical protein
VDAEILGMGPEVVWRAKGVLGSILFIGFPDGSMVVGGYPREDGLPGRRGAAGRTTDGGMEDRGSEILVKSGDCM